MRAPSSLIEPELAEANMNTLNIYSLVHDQVRVVGRIVVPDLTACIEVLKLYFETKEEVGFELEKIKTIFEKLK